LWSNAKIIKLQRFAAKVFEWHRNVTHMPAWMFCGGFSRSLCTLETARV
jgi:hypothetical protein